MRLDQLVDSILCAFDEMFERDNFDNEVVDVQQKLTDAFPSEDKEDKEDKEDEVSLTLTQNQAYKLFHFFKSRIPARITNDGRYVILYMLGCDRVVKAAEHQFGVTSNQFRGGYFLWRHNLTCNCGGEKCRRKYKCSRCQFHLSLCNIHLRQLSLRNQ